MTQQDVGEIRTLLREIHSEVVTLRQDFQLLHAAYQQLSQRVHAQGAQLDTVLSRCLTAHTEGETV